MGLPKSNVARRRGLRACAVTVTCPDAMVVLIDTGLLHGPDDAMSISWYEGPGSLPELLASSAYRFPPLTSCRAWEF